MARHLERLSEERKNWRRDRPFGFVAKPKTNADGSVDLTTWNCTIPGVEGTAWEGGHYPVTLRFCKEYPEKAPEASFPPGFFHVNVYPDGHVCLSILSDDEDLGGQWKPSISIKQILLGIQELLNTPNNMSPAQPDAEQILRNSPLEYNKRVRLQAKRYAASAEN